MKKHKKLLVLAMCGMLMAPAFSINLPMYAKAATTKEESEEDDDEESTETNTENSVDEEIETNTSSSTEDEISDEPGEDADEPTYNISSKIALCDNWETPTARFGQRVSVVLPFVNMDDTDIYDVMVSPQLSTETEGFPFEIEKSGYMQTIDCMPGVNSCADPYERRREITYDFKTRKDVKTGYYKISFDVLFTAIDGSHDSATVDLFVYAVGENGEEGENASVPRVIVTGFSTEPEKVKAGEDFNLTIHLKNTAVNTKISNLKVDLEAASEGSDENTTYQAFLPKEGSSTMYLQSIAADATEDITIAMNAKADLTQKPYVLSVKMEYEDGSKNAYNSESDLSIPVFQEARFDISEPEVMPDRINVNNESNVMFSIYNTGKTKLYNVSVKFEGASISGGDTFVGNIEAGETGNVDAMITGKQVTTDDGIVKAIITYEDESGNANTKEKEFTLFVNEDVGDLIPEDEFLDEDFEEKSNGGVGKIIAVLLVIVVAAVALIAGLKLYKKKKAEKAEQDLLSEIDEEDYIMDDVKDVTEGVEDENSIDEMEIKEASAEDAAEEAIEDAAEEAIEEAIEDATEETIEEQKKEETKRSKKKRRDK